MTPLDDLLRQFDATLPLERARTIPAEWYLSADLADVERRAVFAGWQAVARTDQLDTPGSFVTADVAGEPISVIRDESNTLRAFHNVCRHRAAPLLTEPCGTVNKLRCRYHGWTYDLTGRLRGVPEFDGVCDFDRDANGLVPLLVASWGSTIWVNSEPNPAPLAEFLAPIPEMSAVFHIDQLRWAARREYQLECNWKLYVDNYLDGGYHINTVHPELAGVIDYANYRTELFANSCVQLSPLVANDAIGSVRTGPIAHYWWVFPNFMVNQYDGLMDTNLVLPLGPDRCKVVFDFYFADQSLDFIEKSLAVAERVQQEDMQICAEVQRGLRSRSYDTGRFSVKREAGGYLFHRLLSQHLRQSIST